MDAKSLARRYRIDRPKTFRLKDFDPGDTGGTRLDKDSARKLTEKLAERISGFQDRLYAEDRWAVLLIFQGMDAAGKDGVIERVMAGINPQGCVVHSFKAPSAEELDHDFLWRVATRLPERGRFTIFNRSHYEECLVVRVHPEFLGKQRLPERCVTKSIWKERFEDICAFERHLARSGTLVLKFHLRISKEEQRKRFLERLDEPAKRWKFSMGDVAERDLWDKYMAAYEDMIRNTSTPEAPWYVVPADHKWFARLVVAAATAEALEALDPKFPVIAGKALDELKRVRGVLEAEAPAARKPAAPKAKP